MHVETLSDAAAVAKRGAAVIAAKAREAVSLHGAFSLAVSGGKTPWVMLRELANEKMPWDQTLIFQVDERIAPDGDADRNLTNLTASLLSHVPAMASRIHAMPVTVADSQAAAADYARTLSTHCGSPPVLDLVHLGMGPDGHTASLVPGDTVLDVTDADVALTGEYQNRRRMTLTYPMLNRARSVLWIVAGQEKAERVRQLMNADRAIPAGRVTVKDSLLITDVKV